MMRRKIIGLVLLSLFLLTGCSVTTESNSTSTNNGTAWQQIVPGIISKELTSKGKNLLIISIDPNKYDFSIVENDPQNKRNIQELHEEFNAVVTFNGGFFTEDFEPIGLIISEGVTLSDISRAELMDGIFAIDQENQPQLIYKSDPQDLGQYKFAIQNGPSLINEEGAIVADPNNTQTAGRTAIGIDKQGNIIVILIKQSLLKLDNTATLHELATSIKEEETLKSLGVHSVLNLDGGTSSGIMIKDTYYPEMEKVQHVILVK